MTARVGRVLAIALGLWGHVVQAQAQAKVGFIISGDCLDLDLTQNARQLARELKNRLGDQLLTEDALRARLSPQPSASAEDLERQLEAAETYFYNSEHAKSEATILRALEDIRRLSPGAERWNLTVRAELLQSQVIRRQGRTAEADDLFRHVLRLQPGYQLDADLYMPSIRQRFDRLRSELRSVPKVRVEVKSLPTGAEIFLDGVKQGTAPAALEVWPGDYELIVMRDGQRSLPHRLAAFRENAILVDLQFEGSIQLDREPCFSARPGDERARLAGVLKVATLLGVETMVMLHLDRSRSVPPTLDASVLHTQSGQKIRYAGIQLKRSPQEMSSALSELAKFIVTGEYGKQVMAIDEVAPVKSAALAPPPASTGPEAARPPPWGIIVGSAGLALVAGGATSGFIALSHLQREQLASQNRDWDAYLSNRDAAQTARNVANSLYGAGAVALGVGAFLLVRGPGETRIGATVGPGSASVTIGGQL